MTASATMQQGLFISFEGIDGAGKSTHIAPLAQAFTERGKKVYCSREPGGTPLAETLRELLLHQTMDALTEALLMFAARRDHAQQKIAPALVRGDVVLCDRFADATFAYQGSGRSFDWQTLLQLESMVLAQPDGAAGRAGALLEPDLTLWFDLPAATAAQRLRSARAPDKFEAESLRFFERVNQGYARRAAENPHRFVRINASLDIHAVREQVFSAVCKRGWL